jgi:Protein of unknown function (DUF4012)
MRAWFRRQSPLVRWTLLGSAAAALLWLLASAVLLVIARQRVSEGIQELEDARQRLTPGQLVRGEGREPLRRAREEFSSARDLVRAPVIRPLTFVPFLGQQLRSIDSMTDAATDVVVIGERAIESSRGVLEHRPTSGPERVAVAQQLETVSAEAQQQLRTVDLGSDLFLVGPVRNARDRFAERLREVQDAATSAHDVTVGSGQFLRGPRRYLVLAANNGEMRAGSGMLLSAGVLTVDNGRVELGPMSPTGDLHLPAGAVPVTPPDFDALWGWLHPTQEWRNLAASPRFDITGPLAAEMWRAATGETVDGVLALDPVALQALLAAEGPIDVNGQPLSMENVVPYLLLEQYRDAPPGDPDQTRRDQLGEVARTAVDRLDAGEYEPADLVDALRGAGQGRHVLAWSRDPTEQRGWDAASIAGTLQKDSLLVSVLNTAGNKLDQFLEIDGALSHEERDGGHVVTVRLRFRNDAPAGEPAYVIGPHPDSGVAEGVYSGILAVNVPGSAAELGIEGASKLISLGPDGPTRVATAPLQLARGESAEMVVRFRLPGTEDGLVVEPSARIPSVSWTFEGRSWRDDESERIEW